MDDLDPKQLRQILNTDKDLLLRLQRLEDLFGEAREHAHKCDYWNTLRDVATAEKFRMELAELEKERTLSSGYSLDALLKLTIMQQPSVESDFLPAHRAARLIGSLIDELEGILTSTCKCVETWDYIQAREHREMVRRRLRGNPDPND